MTYKITVNILFKVKITLGDSSANQTLTFYFWNILKKKKLT